MVKKHVNNIPSSFTLGFGVMGFSLVCMFSYMLVMIGSDAWDGCFIYFGGLEGIAYLAVFFMNLRNTDSAYSTACVAFEVK